MDWFPILFIGFWLLLGLVYLASWIGSRRTKSKHRKQAEKRTQSKASNQPERQEHSRKQPKDQTRSGVGDTSEENRSARTRLTESDAELYGVLKDWRDQVAKDQGVSPSRVFTDRALKRIVDKKPSTKPRLRYTRGVGPRRSERYGAGVLSLIPHREHRSWKRNWRQIKKIVDSKRIKKLYHFTDQKNLPSIRINGGLYSWSHCESNDIYIARPGGNQVSRSLDRKNGLEDYVRLSFVKKPPMYHVAKRDGRVRNPVILEVSPEVILWELTLFSDGNATASRARIGGEPEDFRRIRFDILRQSDWTDECEKHYWQAEVLVKTYIPLRYISNYL